MGQVIKPVRYGLIGAGAFGSFCIEHYRKSSLIDVRAVADVNADAAKTMATKLSIDALGSAEELFARDDIDLVHLATPPFTHRELTLKAIAAGKHVLCEKPLATSAKDAREMVDAAAKANRLLVVNLIMRYDPLNEAVATVLREKLLGEPIAASLTNLAGDWKLSPSHWFWDRVKSGGIFVEHSVHFFDLFAMFLGDATVLSGAQATRSGNQAIVDQVMSSARHGSDVLATQYHGFHQPGEMDRQELRIICEKGDIRLFDWLTTRVTIDAMLDEASAQKLIARFPQSPSVKTSALKPNAPGMDPHDVLARHKHWHADYRYAIEATLGDGEKQTLYGDAIRELLEDQVRFIRDPSHVRRVTEANGLKSLEMASRAKELAERE
jgi:predicted dehydrogenase